MVARVLPGLGLTAYYDPGEDGWDETMNPDMRKLSVVTQLAVESRTAALPGSPTQGMVYIAPEGHADYQKVAVYDDNAWVYLQPAAGWIAYVKDDAEHIFYDGLEWSVLVNTGNTNHQTGTAYTLVEEDAEAIVEMDNIAANTLTVPAGVFPVGTTVEVVQIGVGPTTLVADTGVTINVFADDTLTLAGQYASAALYQRELDVWVVAGRMEPA